MSNYKVQILMSTYNGSVFIRKQLDSIMAQDYPVSLLIRDDGSTDDTVSIIKEYEEKYNNISHVCGDNIGVVSSFFELFNMADESADMFALCDQDDIWFPDKVGRAVKCVAGMDAKKPGMYCSAQTLVDAEDNILDVAMKKVTIRPGFGNSLVENIATGCTCMINKTLLEIAKAKPEYTIMHDWWLYMIASSLGNVYYDTEPTMYYRQHGNNTMGTRTNYIDEFKVRVKRFTGNKGKLYRQIQCYNGLHGNSLSPQNKSILNLMLGYRKNIKCRLKCMFGNKVYRQRPIDNLIFKVLFLSNHI
ncbi:MAG: glycosyltransferase family 2 protein [Lachnospiraceae bacterium]|nr:glycosyltransferase family 2 protein [Lachnospiraceae bacterium]